MIDIPDSILPKDAQGNVLCPKCSNRVSLCTCPSYERPTPKQPIIKPVVRLEKSGRSGKTVTLITNLPAHESYLKGVAKALKTKIGSGGTFYIEEGVGTVEIQGDHREDVVRIFRTLLMP